MAISKLRSETSSSEFLHLEGIEYFMFEEDFMEKNIRCIPMIIRFKMDGAAIKLKLSEWGRFTRTERIGLALMSCNNNEEAGLYNRYLTALVKKYTGKNPKVLEVDKTPPWNNFYSVPETLTEKLGEFDWSLSVEQWKSLTSLQRFALVKLCRPGHKNQNLPKAMKEFKLVD